MNFKNTGKVITVMAATVVLIASLITDKKSKEKNEEK